MKIGTTRVESFSDSVISIIITIMVLSMKIPDISHEETVSGIRHYIHTLLPYFLAYAFSYIMIGVFWINHHHMFHLLERTDEKLLFQNLIFLFWMSLIPLGTALISSNPALPESVAIYGGIMLLTTLTFTLMRSYTLRKDLVHRDKDKEVTRRIRWVSLKARTKSFIGTFSYLISIPLAFVSVYLTYTCFLVSLIIFFIPDGIDDEELANKIEEKNG